MMASPSASDAGRARVWAWAALRGGCLCLLAVSLWLAMRGLRPGEIWQAMRGAKLVPLVVAAALSLANLGCKARAWCLMLAPAHPVGFVSMLRYSWVAAGTSQLMPLRAGEAIRVWLLVLRHGVPWQHAAGTAVLEKLLDAASMLVVLSPLLWLGPHLPRWVPWAGVGVGVALLGAAAVVVWTRRCGGGRQAHGRYLAAAHAALARPTPQLAWATAWLLAAWLLDVGMIWLTTAALGLAVAPATPLIVLFFINVAIAVPSTPGQFGTFELAAAGVLAWIGVPRAQALCFGLLYHAIQVGPLMVIMLCELRLLAQALAAARRRGGRLRRDGESPAAR